MGLDIAFLIASLIAFYKGFREGIIRSVISLVALLIGIIAAFHLSYPLSVKLAATITLNPKVLVLIAFGILFIGIIIAFKLVSWVIEKILKTLYLNFFNKIAGGVIWCIIPLVAFSLGIFFLEKNNIINGNQLLTSSIIYPFLIELGPSVFKIFSVILPSLKEVFEGFNELFKQVSEASAS